MSDTEGVSEGGNSDGPGRDEGVSPETEALVEEAMSGARDEAAANEGAGTLTEDDARATQERMEAEGKAARESFERQERARAEATAYADALDQETAALNDAATDAAYAEALDQEVAALEAGLPVAFDDVALAPTLRDQILSDPEAIQDPSDLAELDAFLASDAGIAAARQFEFDRALQSSNLTPDQVTQAMGHFTAGRDLVYDETGQITTLEDGTIAYEVLVADADGGFGALAADDGRSAAEIAADYARGLNETVAAVANSSWGWAAGLAFDAVALAAGGPVRFAVNMAAGEGAAALLEQGLEVGAEYLAERTGMEPEDIAHLAIAGGTILGGAALGWRGVKEITRNLPEKLDDLMGAVRRFRDDDSGSVPGSNERIRGEHSGRTFDPSRVGGPILDLDWRTADITPVGVAQARLHISRFDDFPPNQAMLDRLDRIADGTLEATDFDRRFYTHEIRELERYRAAGHGDRANPGYDDWQDLHAATLEDFGVTERIGTDGNALYHPDAWALRE